MPAWRVAHYLADGRLRIVLEAYQRATHAIERPAPAQPPAPAESALLHRFFAAVLDASVIASLILSDGRTPAWDLSSLRLVAGENQAEIAAAPRIRTGQLSGRNLTTQRQRSPAGRTETWRRGERLPWPTGGHHGPP